jgi:hypothetical protein
MYDVRWKREDVGLSSSFFLIKGTMDYVAKISLNYTLSAYEQVTLQERFDRELKSFLGDKEARVDYIAKDE